MTLNNMLWYLSHSCDPFAREIADRHYNRQKIGSVRFVPPGRCLVLKTITESGRAFWVTSYPFAEYVRHAWAGAWVCSAFRNEGAARSSDLIRQAVSATLNKYGEPPALGMITFVDASKVRKKRDVGRCYRRAGFEHIGYSNSGLHCLQLLPNAMPAADQPLPMGLCP